MEINESTPDAVYISQGFGGIGKVELPCVFVTSFYNREKMALIRTNNGYGEYTIYTVVPYDEVRRITHPREYSIYTKQ
jgi:hypothetical protein